MIYNCHSNRIRNLDWSPRCLFIHWLLNAAPRESLWSSGPQILSLFWR